MPVVNYVVGGAHAGGTWTIQSTNTASVGRYHDLMFWAEGAGGINEFTQCRPGVVPGPADASSNVPTALIASAAGSGLNITIRPGSALVERGTLVGPYGVTSQTTATVTLNTADATNPRIDRVDLQVLDGALGDNGGTSQTAFVVTSGTASGTPALPAAPANSIPICQVLLPAGTVLVTNGMITRTRKSASVRGGSRVLLEGDSIADAGTMVGEKRQRVHTTYGWLEDVWDAALGVWRGTQEIILAQPAQTGTGSLANAATATISSVVVADPGFPFHIEGYGLVDFASGTQGTVLQVALQISSSTFGTNRFAFDQEPAVAANINFDLGSACFGNTKVLGAALTGNQTVFLLAKNAQGPSGAASITIYTNFYGFVLKIVPATV